MRTTISNGTRTAEVITKGSASNVGVLCVTLSKDKTKFKLFSCIGVHCGYCPLDNPEKCLSINDFLKPAIFKPKRIDNA